jgi:RNA polymerase sigma-70 factor (ECF subfamily)
MAEVSRRDTGGNRGGSAERLGPGRREEIAGLVEQHIPALRRYLYVLHRGNIHDAEDSLQDGLLRAMERFDSYSGAGGFRAWLFAICRNSAMDAHRRYGRRREQGGDQSRFFDSLPSPHPGPEQVAEEGEARRLVIDALTALPERFRMPLVLKEIEGFSVAEAAEILGVPEGTVKSRLSTGRSKLAKAYSRLAGESARGGSDG